MSTHETLRPAEHFHASEAPGVRGSRVTEAHVDAMYTERRSMLESLGAAIGARLYEALGKKIDHERSSLRSIIERDEAVTETKRRLDKVLKSEYFIYRKLDTHLL